MATGSASSYPTAYETSGTISGTRYKNAVGKGADTSAVSGNDYSNGGSSSKAYIYYSFDFDSIPENATITSVSCRVKGHAENTSRSTCNVQLYVGTSTAKGSSSKFTSTSAQTLTLTTGSWTRSEVDDMRLRFEIGYYGGLINGATVTIEYEWNDTKWTVTVTGGEPAGDTEVPEGESFTARCYRTAKPVCRDNGTDVSASLVQGQDTPESYTVETASGASYGFELNSSGYYVSQNKGHSKTAAVCVVHFHLPVSATVTFSYINYAEAGYDFGVFGDIDTELSNNYYAAGSSGATITDSHYKLACNTSAHNTSSVQTLRYAMEAGDHYIYVKYSKDDASDANNDTLQFKVSITLDETPTYATYWAYTISSVTGAHTIVFSSDGQTTIRRYNKVNGTWVLQSVEITAVYSKGASWAESDPGNISSSTNFVEG